MANELELFVVHARISYRLMGCDFLVVGKDKNAVSNKAEPLKRETPRRKSHSGGCVWILLNNIQGWFVRAAKMGYYRWEVAVGHAVLRQTTPRTQLARR